MAEMEEAFTSVSDGIGELVLNRPERKNALSPTLVAALSAGAQCSAACSGCFFLSLAAPCTAGLDELIADERVIVILIRGNGPEPTADSPTARWLCSGVDLKEQQRVRKETGTDGGQGKNWARFHATMYACPKPTIGVLEGGVIAGGTGLAFACDFLITGKQARFHVAEVNFGLAAPYNVRPLLARLFLAALLWPPLLARPHYPPL